MSHPDNVQKQLAHEEAELARTRQEILSTEERIQRAQRQIAELRQRLSDLKQGEAAAEKRVGLLQEYIDIAPPKPNPAAQDVRIEQDEEVTGYPLQEVVADKELKVELSDLESGALSMDNMMADRSAPQKIPDPPDPSAQSAGGFDQLDDEKLSMELLPRTQTFEEELLIILAYHRKPLEPKDVARLFRRMDHTPKIKPTEDSVKAQISSTPHLYEQTSDGRFGLSHEGREEARRLLMGLA